MRMRNLLAAAAVSAIAIGGVGLPAHAATAPPPADAGTLVSWGNADDANAGAAIPIPEDLTGLVRSVATDTYATGVVTLDGGVRVLGSENNGEVAGAPSGVTDATAITLSDGNGAILHADGRVTAWGSGDVSDVPSDLRAKAIALQQGTGYAIRTDGTLATWGDAPFFPTPTSGLTDLVDISASLSHVMALRSDGTVVMWGSEDYPGVLDVPDFGGKKVVQIATAMVQSGVVFEDGTIDVWGFGPLLPSGQPDFDGSSPATTVTSLALSGIPNATAAAVTADGAVHTWGGDTHLTTVPASLTGQPVSAVAMSVGHAVAIVTAYREVTRSTISGDPAVGQTLTATPATYSLDPDSPVSGQWYAGDDEIEGQTGTTLTVDDSLLGKTLTYRTSATRGKETLNTSSKAFGPIRRAESTVKLKVTPAKAAAGKTRTITATVTRAGGTPTGTITFKAGNQTRTDILEDGKATWKVPTSTAGTQKVIAAYSGDELARPATATPVNVTATKASSKVSAAAKANGSTVKITVTVKAPKGVSLKGKVTVALKGKTKKTVKATVNASGKATVTVKKVKHGKYKATVKYAGNNSVKASKTTKKFKA